MLIELLSWLIIYTLKPWKSFAIGVSCFRVRALCLLVSVKSLFTKFIWTTEKLSDWWFKIFVMRWYYWQFTGQMLSWQNKIISAIHSCHGNDRESQWMWHLVSGRDVVTPRTVKIVYSAVVRRSQSVFKVANVTVKRSRSDGHWNLSVCGDASTL